MKAIGQTVAAKPLLDKAGIEVNAGMTHLDGFVEAAGNRYRDRESKARGLA